MIYGNGLIASAFRNGNCKFDNVVIYASGVSNSGCIDQFEFDREEDLLRHACQQEPQHHLFVYFGTCSVYDPEKVASPYVKHKLHMESVVRGLRGNYLIVRLPNVVGRMHNPYTLVNQFDFSLSNKIPLSVHIRAERNLIDVEDVAIIVTALISQRKLTNYTVNVANSRNYPVLEIVKALAEVKCMQSFEIISLDRGASYAIHIEAVQTLLDRLGIKFDDDYLKRVLRKYYGSTV